MSGVKNLVWVAFLGLCLNAAAAARADLLNYWTFDDSGNVGAATVGTDLTAAGDAQYTAAGQSGGGLLLDGNGDYLGGSPTVAIGNSAYTTTAWIKPTVTGDRGIVGWGNYGQTRRVNAFRLMGDNSFRHYWWGADIDRNASTAGVDLDDGAWHHVTATYNGTSRALYVDGRPIGSDMPGVNDATAANFRIGSTNNAEWFGGTIDGVALYDHALAPHQIRALAAGGDPTNLPTGLIHRWSFSESGGAGTTLVDSVGGQNATIVDVGANDGTVGGGQVTLAGGAKDSSDYVGLPAGLISSLGDVTIETWATQHSVQNWSRVFDFGLDTNNNLLMSWTRGTNINQDRVSFKIGSEHAMDERMAPYTLDQQFHIVMTIDDDGGPNGETQIKVFKDGIYRGTRNSTYNLSQLIDDNNFLGRSQYGDNTANASWNELRIYNEELSEDQILNSFNQGPDVASLSPGGPQALTVGPIHRWSFSETGGAGTTLVDSIGGADGTIVDVGGNDGTVGGGQVTLAGGAKDSSDYVDLPDGLVSGLTDATIETWATQHSVQNWSRVFDFGQDTTNNMLMAWTRGTNINQDRAGMKINNAEQSVDEMMAPYTLDQEFHIVMTIDEDAVGGQTLIRLYKDGQLMGGRLTDYTLSQLNDVNNWLGRSQYGDNTANASWNEFRIYDYLLSENQILGNFAAGPDVVNIGAEVIPEPSTLALLGLGGLGLLVWRRRRRAGK